MQRSAEKALYKCCDHPAVNGRAPVLDADFALDVAVEHPFLVEHVHLERTLGPNRIKGDIPPGRK